MNADAKMKLESEGSDGVSSPLFLTTEGEDAETKAAQEKLALAIEDSAKKLKVLAEGDVDTPATGEVPEITSKCVPIN